MKNKHITFIKISASVLSFILFLFCVLNIISGIFLYSQNLLLTDKETYSKKIYSFATEITANDLVNYYYISNEYKNNSNSYYKNEHEIYLKKYDRQHSNAAFMITDKEGKEILKNYSIKDPLLDYSYSFPVTYDYKNDTYPETTYYEEVTTAVAVPDNYNITTDKSIDVYIEENEYNRTVLIYYFEKEDIDKNIYNYCLNLFDNDREKLSTYSRYVYNTSDDYTKYYIYQEDFSVSSNGVVFFNDKNHLPYTDTEETSFNDTDTEELTVTVFVPHKINENIKDIYYYFENFINFTFSYFQHIIPVTICLFILALGLFVISLKCAGYKENDSKPSAYGLHKLPFDIHTVLLAGVTFGLCWGVDELIISIFSKSSRSMEALIIIFTSVILIIAGMVFINNLCIQIKCHRFPDCISIIKLFKVLIEIIKKLSNNTKLFFKSLFILFIKTIIELFIIGPLSDFTALGEELGAAYTIFLIIEIPLWLLVTLNLELLRTGAKEIADGNIKHIIHSRFLFGDFKKHAEALNSINTTINSAVEERVKSESTKTELITNVSHDLKTPLTSIINYIDLLNKEDIDNEKAREYISVIDRQAQRLKKLTGDIVEASKAASGNINVNFEKTDLNVLLSQANAEYEERLNTCNLTLECTFPDESVEISADGRLLWRIFDNLLSNICKYSMPGTRVYIDITKDSENAYVSFKNISYTMLNISPQELTERFVRGDMSRNSEGSGLGLSIAKSLTEIMNGNLDITIDGDLFKVIITFRLI